MSRLADLVSVTDRSALAAVRRDGAAHPSRRIGVRPIQVRAAILLYGLLVAVWLIASLDLPLSRDQGIFAWIGTVILHGGLPYVDAWDVKGPGAHALYALALGLFGPTERAVRCFDLLFQLAALTAFSRAGWVLERPLAGVVGFVIAVAGIDGSWQDSAQPDGWAAILLVWSSVLLMKRRTSVAAMAGACLLIAGATLIKPVYPLFAIVPLVKLLDPANCGRRLRLWLAAWLGGSLPIGAGLIFYAMTGHLDALFDVLVRFDIGSHLNAQHLGLRELAGIAIRTMVANRLSAPALLLGGIGLISLWRRNPGAAWLLATAVAAGAACVIVQGKFYLYQRLPFFDPIALLGGFGFIAAADYFVRSFTDVSRSVIFRVASVLLLLLPAALLIGTAETSYAWLLRQTGRLSEDAYVGQFVDTDFSTADTRAAARLVDQMTAPGDPIYLWGFDALVYFLADRPAATRLGYDYPMVIGSPDYIDKSRHELLAALARNPPRAILVEDDDANNLMPQTSRASLRVFPELQSFIATHYTSAGGNPHFLAYIRR